MTTLINKEAQECVERSAHKKKNFTPTATELLPMWIYVLINSDVPNLLTECNILSEFRLKDYTLMSEADYNLSANLITAVESLKKEGTGIQTSGTTYKTIQSYKIESSNFMPEQIIDNFGGRAHSMSTYGHKTIHTGTSKDQRDDSGLISNLTSSIKGLFKQN